MITSLTIAQQPGMDMTVVEDMIAQIPLNPSPAEIRALYREMVEDLSVRHQAEADTMIGACSLELEAVINAFRPYYNLATDLRLMEA